jgi:bacterial/archaeal transporter family-2 protein
MKPMALLWVLLGVISGACIAVQAPINAKLGATLGLPFAAAFVSFAAGAIILGIVTFAVAGATNTTINWSAPAWWMFVAGGALGTVYVTSAVVLTPQIGAAAVMGLAVTGQLLAGLAVDRTGFLGAPIHELSAGRIAGAALLVAGAVMIRLL